ncbi:MAG: ATP-binding protein, partial [Bryobacteraceae bacterium]
MSVENERYSAALHNENAAYIVWGVEDATHAVVGTVFKPRSQKVGNEDLEPWLSRQLRPGVHFVIHEFTVESRSVVLFEIQPCVHIPVRWKDHAYIRVGSYKKKLRDHPEKERTLWARISQVTFEKELAAQSLTGEEVLARLDYPSFFEMLGQPVASTRPAILDR